MRVVTELTPSEDLDITKEQRSALGAHLRVEVEDAISALYPLHQVIKDCLRMYAGIPKVEHRTFPILNAPNIEITIGAIAADSVYSQFIDTLFGNQQLVTVRAGSDFPGAADNAKAIQALANKLARTEEVRPAIEDAILDQCQLGTGVLYIPWTTDAVKTDRLKTRLGGPRIYYIPVEDLIVPLSPWISADQHPWVGIRTWLSRQELQDRATMNAGWDIENCQVAGEMSDVRLVREMLGNVHGTIARKGNVFELFDIYIRYDIDEDGFAEDLYVVWDRTSANVVYASYAPVVRRPIELMRYQKRAGLPYGLGILEMLRSYEEEITEVHYHRVLNMLIANSRIWKWRSGQKPDDPYMFPGRSVELDDPNSLAGEQMGDIYTSSPQAEAITVSLAERRVGVNDVSIPRPSQVLGSRTPGITALTLFQSQNRRFTAAFDGVRLGAAGAVRQKLIRIHEQLVEEPAMDGPVHMSLIELLGNEKGRRCIAVLSGIDFIEEMQVEMTASSASINAEADKQNAMLITQLLGGYYERILQLASVLANPTVPPLVKETAEKVAKAASEIIERTLLTFDQVRDPKTFIIELESELDGLNGLDQGGLAGLVGLLGGAGAGSVEGGAPGSEAQPVLG